MTGQVPTVLVFVKYPKAGEVKTRLAASIGAERAAALYYRWIGLVFDRLQPLRHSAKVVAYFTGAPQDAFVPWQAFADEWWAQPSGDLGERLCAGFEGAHGLGGPVAAVGTDCLEIDAHLLHAAFDLLYESEVVFGPAEDGGYYLVGTAKLIPGFFQGIPWSSPDTLAAQLSRCRRNGWSVSMLPVRRDIDTWDDWLLSCGGSGEET